jgi:Ycf66 protein N-terminus
MLAYILAVVVGTGSGGLYLAAFFLPAVHRRQDFIWSGVGLFYALFLWLYARQVTGGILVGQTTSVVLLGWLTWQLFNLRRQVEPVSQQIPIPSGVTKSIPKATKSTAKPAAVTPAASTPLANARVPAKAATTPDRASKTTSNPVPTSTKTTAPVTPVGTEAAPRERKAAPVSVAEIASPLENRSSQPPANPSVITPVAPPPTTLDPDRAMPVERKTAPTPVGGASPLENRISSSVSTAPVSTPQPSNLAPVTATPVEPKIAPAPDRSSQPPNPPPTLTPQPILAAAEEERAWITLEVKPAPSPAPPLGTPAQPPAAKIPPTPQPKVVPEVTPTQNISASSIETTAKLDSEDTK